MSKVFSDDACSDSNPIGKELVSSWDTVVSLLEVEFESGYSDFKRVGKGLDGVGSYGSIVLESFVKEGPRLRVRPVYAVCDWNVESLVGRIRRR